MRPAAGFTGADAGEPAEEAAVPRQADRDRLVQRVAAPAAEMPDRVIALTALAADEVAGMAAGRRFHRAGRLTWAGDRRRDRRRPPRHRFVGGHRWWGEWDRSDRSANAREDGSRGGGRPRGGPRVGVRPRWRRRGAR